MNKTMEKAYFSNIRRNILAELVKAEKEIKVAVCWFTNQQLFDVLCEKVQAGVSVDLIILNDYINNRDDGLDFQHFIELGGKFYFGDSEKPMHNKYCIIDNRVLINGSYNWTYFAENKNEENIIIHFSKKNLLEEFSRDFKRIKSSLKKVKHVVKNSIVEIVDLNFLGSRNYLAQDYLYQAMETKNPTIVKKAFKLTPTNIQIQKKAVEFNLRTKRKTTTPIGEEIVNDGFTVLIPAGTEIPASGQDFFTTTKDKQLTTNVTIRYGACASAKANKLIGSFEIAGIPPKKKGKPTLITKWSVDLHGILRVTEIVKKTNNSVTMSYDIKHLLTKII